MMCLVECLYTFAPRFAHLGSLHSTVFGWERSYCLSFTSHHTGITLAVNSKLEKTRLYICIQISYIIIIHRYTFNNIVTFNLPHGNWREAVIRKTV